jgi:hypothetical protein
MVPEFNRILSRLFRVHLSFSDGRFALHYCSGNGVHERSLNYLYLPFVSLPTPMCVNGIHLI